MQAEPFFWSKTNRKCANWAEKVLRSLGFTVLLAKDGVEAVEVFRQHQDEVRCVLSDLTMPRMNGWETLAALRKLAPGLPVILASGYDEAHVMAGDHPELPQAFLSKPYRVQELRDAIAAPWHTGRNRPDLEIRAAGNGTEASWL
jgi:two-component system, cell cycle sensor histidine kinase and response regulator CckA